MLVSEKKRVVAKKVRIIDVVNGRYFAGSKEEMKASYVISPFGDKISRVNVVGTVTEKFSSDDGMYSSITVDDTTGIIRVKAFGDDSKRLGNFEIGDTVLVIGKVKQYNGEVYVNSEIVRKADDANMESVRRLEILKDLAQRKKNVEKIKELAGQYSGDELAEIVNNRFGIDKETLQFVMENLKVQKQIDYVPKMLEVIQALDDGNGVEIGKLLQISDLPENIIESAINELLANGTLFEPRPGILKKV